MKLAVTALLALSSAPLFAAQFDVLVFSRTAGWHHESIHEGVTALRELGRLHDFNVFWTEDAKRVFNDKELARYQAVVFLSTTGDVLDDEQQRAFQRYVRAGGGYVGVHAAADTEHGWPWYRQLVGHMFVTHPAVQSAVLKVEDANFPGMERFAPRTLVTEEWYEYGAAQSTGLRYLLSVDEATYRPETAKGKGMGAFHPISWYQQYDGGRAFYTALGHLPATYGDPVFRHHLYGGIYWAATGRGFQTAPAAAKASN
ncbi:ThuA domain-containing protein [Pseudoduganella sp. SL102]|uniref:ThuA domain-containing protein n=1 Tax=Pseudoduganella sp. SL102 TaxID=2995154 RepID=UPI00248C6B54|nr:ThuA domain-containing protein [Pseudoduganella sp. SL102]WBS01032.1 ThuA domain-containing protein [Pseudoduganella sp. SL102]